MGEAVTASGVCAAIRRAHPEAEVFVYPDGHGFNCTDRADHDPESAALALTRTRAFLEQHLAGTTAS